MSAARIRDTQLYDLLGVDPSADDKQIRAAYLKLALKLHPDKHQNSREAGEKFKALLEAYETLSDAKKRADYDRYGLHSNAAAGASENAANYSESAGAAAAASSSSSSAWTPHTEDSFPDWDTIKRQAEIKQQSDQYAALKRKYMKATDLNYFTDLTGQNIDQAKLEKNRAYIKCDFEAIEKVGAPRFNVIYLSTAGYSLDLTYIFVQGRSTHAESAIQMQNHYSREWALYNNNDWSHLLSLSREVSTLKKDLTAVIEKIECEEYNNLCKDLLEKMANLRHPKYKDLYKGSIDKLSQTLGTMDKKRESLIHVLKDFLAEGGYKYLIQKSEYAKSNLFGRMVRTTPNDELKNLAIDFLIKQLASELEDKRKEEEKIRPVSEYSRANKEEYLYLYLVSLDLSKTQAPPRP